MKYNLSLSLSLSIDYSDKFSPKRKLQNCLLLLEGTCQCIELEPADIKNTKASANFLKRRESIEN